MDKDHHMVAIGLVKAKQFLDDKYLKKFSAQVTKGIFVSKISAAIALGKTTHHIL